MKNIRFVLNTVLLSVLSLPLITLADNTIANPLGNGNTDLFAFINNLIDAILKIGAIVAVLAIIYAGFLFVTARGDEKQLGTAKNVLLYSVIGIAILLGARVISSVIITTVKEVGSAAN
jgi:type IV secretory pathway VirB2 component (pilin)